MQITKKYYIIILISVIILIVFACGGSIMEKGNSLLSIDDVDLNKIRELTQKSIYFGHQSVGYNILDGIQDQMKEMDNIRFTIVETTDVSKLDGSFFIHSRIGRNSDPLSKMDDFKRIFEQGICDKVDIAFMKLCYVDINVNTDIHKVFEYYKKTLEELKEKYPDVIFVHFTVPLTSPKKDFVSRLKRFIKQISGKYTWEFDDNIKRNLYNDLIIKEYMDKEPVFDLARIESSYMDGRRTKYKKGKTEFYTMVPEYTDDSGHLNETGRKIVAGQLLIFLSEL